MMHNDSLENRELVSALVDGQLHGEEFGRVVASFGESGDAIGSWHIYHLVGDVLRCPDLESCRDGGAFVARWRDRLAASSDAEPGVGWLKSPDAVLADPLTPVVMVAGNAIGRESANDAARPWKLLAALASVAALTVAGWHLAAGEAGSVARLASVPVVAPAAPSSPAGDTGPAVVLRDAQLDQLLAAHKQLGGTSALQMPAGFLRNATFESPGR
jgi:sigma-E factor negative regulatory protein RseA